MTGGTWVERLGYVAAGAILASAVSSVAQSPDAPPLDALYRKLEVLAEVFGQIENHYVDAVSPTDLAYAAARGALSVLDPHSTFFSPADYKSLLDATEGEYAGIGIEIDMRDHGPEVLSVFDDSPAARAGLRAGDTLLAVDGRDVEGMDFDTVERLLRGPVGSKVVLSVRRAERHDVWSYALLRGWVRLAPLAHRAFPDGVGYVQVKVFSRRVAADLEAMLLKVPPRGGLVLDLRDNPGGLFDEAVEVCDLFLLDGPIVTAMGRGGSIIEQQMAHAHGTQPPYKLAVLIDSGSASAAEIVAGALRDRGRARLFGSRSYGKGSVQSILDLSDGSGLKLTIARYLTPSGRQIDGHGIDPDEVVVNKPQDPTDAVLAVALAYVRSST